LELLEEIARLTQLQALDQQLRLREQELSRVTARVDELRVRVAQSASELERLHQEEQQSELARRELERTLAEGEVQIRNKRMRLSLIKNDRELQALAHEVDTLKETNQRLEADLLSRMEGGDQRSRQLQELSDGLKRDSDDLSSAEHEVSDQAEELRAGIENTRREREALAAQLDPLLCQRYEMIFDRRGGLAVVAVRAGTCQGCRMRIPPQLFNEIQKQLAIHYCPNCQRILFFEPERESGQ
jgi:predicted  nucleic acid-binding Zn-ribbon protein